MRNTTVAHNDNTLAFDLDKYDGVLVNSKQLPENIEDFDKQLKVSMEVWRNARKRGVWLKIPADKIDFVPLAMKKFGFKLHHSKPGYVMLTNWLLKVGWEVVLTPVTYGVVGWLKRKEGVDIFDEGTNFSPFKTKV
jgi:hypothetical protein